MEKGNRNTEILNLFGICMQEIEGKEESYKFLSKKVDNSKESILTLFHLGTMGIELKRYQESIEYFKKIERLHQGIGDVYF